ncbi:MAG: hypothetical protein J3K34DRAFT_33335 [Monoraphidium minutum]|nr:MAG: hypothetical protein J3K34DRAFT_33335 [Monoraphidium minutum]
MLWGRGGWQGGVEGCRGVLRGSGGRCLGWGWGKGRQARVLAGAGSLWRPGEVGWRQQVCAGRLWAAGDRRVAEGGLGAAGGGARGGGVCRMGALLCWRRHRQWVLLHAGGRAAQRLAREAPCEPLAGRTKGYPGCRWYVQRGVRGRGRRRARNAHLGGGGRVCAGGPMVRRVGARRREAARGRRREAAALVGEAAGRGAREEGHGGSHGAEVSTDAEIKSVSEEAICRWARLINERSVHMRCATSNKSVARFRPAGPPYPQTDDPQRVTWRIRLVLWPTLWPATLAWAVCGRRRSVAGGARRVSEHQNSRPWACCRGVLGRERRRTAG